MQCDRCASVALSCELPLSHSYICILIPAWQLHRDSEGVQLNGCWAIGNLALEDSNREKTARFKGHQLVITALRVFTTSPGVQQYASWALASLAVKDTLQARSGIAVMGFDCV